MILGIHQFINSRKPRIKGFLFKLLFSSKRIKVGKQFRCDTFPTMIINKGCRLEIGDNVLFRRNVELRAHGNSKIIIRNNIRIDRGVRLLAANDSKILLENGVGIGLYSVLNGGDSITLGEKVLLSGFIYIQTSKHNQEKGKGFIRDQGFTHAPVVVEKDVWLGAHVMIMPGCILEEGAIVGSNSVVTKSVKSFDVVGGVPAKFIKERS
jgi:acetyltransferase-like isoleucine patch superfamily enzyme